MEEAPRAVKQRQAAKREEGAADSEELLINTAMRRDWASGALQSPKVFEYVYKASQQHMQGGGKLNKLPSSDKVAYRDLRRALGWPKGAPELVWLSVPGGKAHPVICPMSYVEATLRSRREFDKRIKGPRGAIRDFWSGMGDHPIRRGGVWGR